MAGQGVDRREVLRIMAMAAAASHFPGFARWAFAAGHPSQGIEEIKPATYEPIFFSKNEYPLVEKLAELIIPSDRTPGAREAGVSEFIDFMIFHDPDQQYSFRTGLSWLNAHAEQVLGKPFLALSGEQQVTLLEPLAFSSKHKSGEEDGQQFFRAFREMTVAGFYTTEIGYKELDNPALKYYSESPACPHRDDPEHKHLPAPKW